MATAETIINNLAERFRATGKEVTVERTEREPICFEDGRVMLDGTVTWSIFASEGLLGSYHAAWQTRTTGRKTTAFLCGSRSYGLSGSERKFNGPRQALSYADMFAR